jgi:FAD/FMN-containing dehydrogenase
VSGLLERLQAVLGPEHVLVDPDLRASYETDWTRRWTATASAVVRPADTSEVADVVRTCAAAGQPMVIRGGGTGLVNGSVPAAGEVVVSLERLRTLDAVDEVSAQITVGAGVTLAALQAQVRPLGLDFGVDFAARDSCTLGGMVATNAGGERVLRWGVTRTQVAGIEAVLADGTVISRLAGLPKDNTGYDLPGLLAGSEGTLAVITRLRLRLVPRLPARVVALLALESVAAAVDVVRRLRSLASLEAAELFLADGLTLVRRHTGSPAPFVATYPVFLLAECAARTDPSEELLELLEGAAEVADAVIASDAPGRSALWRYREAHTESINAEGVPVKLDVAVPLPRLAEAVDRLPGVVAAVAPGARTVLFGHVNEGNLHVNVLGAPDAAAEHAVEVAVLELVAGLDGSISAEHGVGRAKREFLRLSRGPAEIAAMQAIKSALDPNGMLNPGVLLP